MQTRHKSSTPRTAEVQQQIASDAKLAKKISMLPRSPDKRDSGSKHKSIKAKSLGRIKASPRRLVFANSNGKGDMVSPRGASEVAAEEPAHWHVISGSESEDGVKEAMDPANVAEEPRSAVKRLRSLFKEMRKAG